MPVPPFKFFWIAWLLAFAIVEIIALRREGGGDTFSEFVWWIIGTGESERDTWQWVARVFVIGFMVWLVPHFATGWKWFK